MVKKSPTMSKDFDDFVLKCENLLSEKNNCLRYWTKMRGENDLLVFKISNYKKVNNINIKID